MQDLGVDEETIEKLHTYDWAVFNSDRRYYQRLNHNNHNKRQTQYCGITPHTSNICLCIRVISMTIHRTD